ncbi:TRAP dicarboxylate transporter- DctP subunit [Magnetococcus marinus MC-1]|uniref:TRAP dicarboxylate transporter-DctP subunit n=1 Tax=Magnetococcus marinus (strain ATCC BAA-1437 / JCM 17883 / MC-1) TaxID=156889 RepID=A0LDV6_MAGMM|nr:TRAP transporter substrate-binding protein DctP [Magnetococcus marinus]ABK46149.1 TRAP dicarboxylate transporter- DctP subunit [Magnetococcus marinus MC-1]
MHHTMFQIFCTLLTPFALLVALWTTPAYAQNPVQVMRIGATQGMDMTYIRNLRRMAADIEQATAGQVKVEILHNGQQGNEISMVKALIEGKLEGGFVSASTLSQTLPAYQLLLIPRLFVTPNQLVQFIGSRYDQKLRLRAMRKRIQVLGYGGTGFYGVTTFEGRAWPELRGATIRAPGVIAHQKNLELMGLKPSYVPAEAVPEAIQAGWLQGISSTPELLARTRVASQGKQFYSTHHLYGWMTFIVSNRWYANLSKELRQQLRETVANGLRQGFSESLRLEQKLLGDWSAGHGPQPTPVDEQALAEQLKPEVGQQLQALEKRLGLHGQLWQMWVQNNGLMVNTP